MTEQNDIQLAKLVIDPMKDLHRHWPPDILIATKSGNPLSEPERLEFFRGLQGRGHAQPVTSNPSTNGEAPDIHPQFIQQSAIENPNLELLSRWLKENPGMSSGLLQQTPPNEFLEYFDRFYTWVEDTFSGLDPTYVKDCYQASVAIRNMMSNNSFNIKNVTDAVLPIITFFLK